MSDIEPYTGPEASPAGPEVTQGTGNPESAAEELPASLVARRDVMDGAFALTSGLQEEATGKGDSYLINKRRTISDGQSQAIITETVHDPRADLFHDEASQRRGLRPRARRLGKIEMVYGRPDGGQSVHVYDLSGEKEDPQIHKSSLELTKEQVARGSSHNSFAELDQLIRDKLGAGMQKQGASRFDPDTIFAPDDPNLPIASDVWTKIDRLAFPVSEGPVSEAEAKRLTQALEQLNQRAS